MQNILVVQSQITESRLVRERENFQRSIGDAARADFLSSVDERLAWSSPEDFLKGYEGLVFGGSADFDFHGGRQENDPARIMSAIILSRARNIVAYAMEKDIPILGVCFGHQLIAQMHGGMVSNDREQSKFGSHEVHLTEAGKHDPLFGQLPHTFTAQYAHKDSATNLPTGAELLASSPGCAYSALRYGARTYTTQFHPELETFADLPLEYKPSPEASSIIKRWLALSD